MKIRLYSKRKPRMAIPLPAKKDKGFSLRQISEADSRYAVVKEMRKRLEQLKNECGVDSIQKEWLCGRAVVMLAYLESLEVDALEGKPIDWRQYLGAVKSFGDVLNKLGLEKDTAPCNSLHRADQRTHIRIPQPGPLEMQPAIT